MSNTTLVKQEGKPVSVKEQMSYVEALQVIEKQNRKIKESAKNRMKPINPPNYSIYGRNLAKSFSSVVLGMATFITLGSNGMMDHIAAGLFTFGAFAVGGIGSIIISGSGKYSRIVSPVKYRQLVNEYDAHENLRKLKESEYSKVETKALKKASTAMEIANRTLASKSKEIGYANRLGKEGFSVVEVGDPSDISQEMLRAISESEQSVLIVPDETKALVASRLKELEPSV